MPVYSMFCRTGGVRNPIVIVKIFIFIFLQLKVVLQAKPCKGGRCIWRVSPDYSEYLRHKKITYICLQGAL